MALPVISAVDFVGKVNISQSTYSELPASLPAYTEQYIKLLLGERAYADIVINDRDRWDLFLMVRLTIVYMVIL